MGEVLYSIRDETSSGLCTISIVSSSVPGEYWVVGVDLDQYDPEEPAKYLQGLLQDELDPVALRGFRSYLGVLPSPSRGFENFTKFVNKYMEGPPFNFPNPVRTVGGVKLVRDSRNFRGRRFGSICQREKSAIVCNNRLF